jgi:sterol 3beta-glucosyltransferase
MRRILFSADGSGGDLLPMVLMAREFRLAGYDVCVCGSSEFAKMAQDFDVPFEPYPHNYSEIYLENQKTGYVHNIRENIRHQERLFQGEFDVLSKIAPEYDVLINFLAEIFVPSVAEAFGLPNIKLYTFPVVECGTYGPPSGLPFVTENEFVNRLQWKGAIFAAKHLFSYNTTVDRLRAKLGLPPSTNLLATNSRCDHMMIGLYEELLPPGEGWRNFDYTYIGPVLPRTQPRLSDPLEAFLAAGDEPIYIGFGSMRHAESDRLTRILVQAVEDAGVRAIIAQSTSQIGSGLQDSDRIHVLKEYPIPHHVLFPRLRAAVHHGSWITTHLAAQAGIPQLVLPQASDQYLWGDRVMKAGLGPKWVDMNRLDARKLAQAISQLTERADFAENARAFGERVRGIDGARNAVQLFQRLEGGLRRRTTVGASTGSAQALAR